MDEHFEAQYPKETRNEEIEKILNYIKEGNSCQIVSLPGVGRSNLLGLLAYNKGVRLKHLGEDNQNFHFVYLNFSEIRKKPLAEATKFIFLGLIDSLRERKMTKDYEVVNKIFKESMQIKDDLVIFSGLKKAIDYLALERDLTIVFLFDRFEDYITVLDSDFFANLRILRNRAKYKFSVVFSLNRPLEDILEGTLFADFYDFVAGKIIYLPIFNQIGIDFRLNYLEKITGKKLNPGLKENIFELTGGHSNLMRLATESLLSSTQDFKNKLELRNYLIEQKPIRSALFAIWNFLTPSEQTMLTSGKIETNEFLENIGLVKNHLLTISLLADYVKDKASSPESTKIALNEKGEVIKGDIIISELLTALEFKLLKFLMDNKDAIVEKEQVINAVWGDQKTVLGVTDQAVDQLIFRLRKKIEENPNDPKFIQTIKGRGFKFTN